MYKKILVPLDGSELAERALDEAKHFIQSDNKECLITLLKINEIFPVTSQDKNIEIESLTKKNLEYLDKQKVKLEKSGYNAVAVVKNGSNPAIEICKYAENDDVDVVIIASHGIGGVLQWALGSHADKVIRHCTKPVLVISCRECKLI